MAVPFGGFAWLATEKLGLVAVSDVLLVLVREIGELLRESVEVVREGPFDLYDLRLGS